MTLLLGFKQRLTKTRNPHASPREIHIQKERKKERNEGINTLSSTCPILTVETCSAARLRKQMERKHAGFSKAELYEINRLIVNFIRNERMSTYVKLPLLHSQPNLFVVTAFHLGQ